jgi:hypothetical protein
VRPAIPPWEQRASTALRRAAREVRLIGHATPRNLLDELRSLEQSYTRGQPCAPRFAYVESDHLPLARELEQLATALQGEGELGALYAARATELALEARLCSTAGRDGFWQLARQRYAPRDEFDERSDGLCAEWLELDDEEPEGALIRSDDEDDPRSLVRLMRQAVGERRLPVRVVVSSRLSARAATGPGMIYVAKGVPMRLHAARRTVLHEVEGHAVPRQLAQEATIGIFDVGTARGSDDQEGRALLLELDSGLLDPKRRRELALRHRAGRLVEQAASFEDTMADLEGHRVGLRERLRIAARAHRGGGLAREVVYLAGLLRVQAALQRDGSLADVLAAGRVAVEAAERLRAWL